MNFDWTKPATLSDWQLTIWHMPSWRAAMTYFESGDHFTLYTFFPFSHTLP